MNLYEVMMGAQGGQGVNSLANQFGLSAQQTQAALQAMLPAFSLGLQNVAQNPTGFATLLEQMTNATNAAAYSNPAQIPAAMNLGGAILGQIFGSPQIALQIGQQAALSSGVSAQAIQQMMPLVASMLMGGIAQAMAAQGLGGMVRQLASAFAAGAGLNPVAPAPPVAANLLAAWMTMLSGLMGARAAQTSLYQTGLATLNSMLDAGVKVSNAQQKSLNDLLQSITDATKKA
ncbi:MAG: DUF937 domain-containing protein [Roseiarcus sp.]